MGWYGETEGKGREICWLYIGRLKGVWSVTAKNGEGKDRSDSVRDSYRPISLSVSPHHPLEPFQSASRRRQYNPPKRRNSEQLYGAKTPNSTTIRSIVALESWNNSSEIEINWTSRAKDLIWIIWIQSNRAKPVNRNVFARTHARTRVARCHAKWIVISIFTLQYVPHMRKPGPPCAAIDWHCFLFSSWTIEILLRKLSTNKIINYSMLRKKHFETESY